MYPHLMNTLKATLRARGWTYARLGEAIGLSESGVKKIFAAEDGSFERVVRICDALDLGLEELLALVDASPAPWRLTEEQEALFRRDPRCWWFLQALSAQRWDADAVARRHDLEPVRVEGWLAALERRGVIRRTPTGQLHPADAAGSPWQAGPAHGDAVVAPQQDALLAHARERIRDRDAHPLPGHTECGYGQLRLSPEAILELKQALRDVVSEFATRSRRQQLLRGGDGLVEVGVLTVMAPFSLADGRA